jgi:exosome complex component RRP42
MEEEACMDARITITTNSNGEYTAIQKGSNGFLTIEQIKEAAKIAQSKGAELRQKFIGLISNGK